MRIVKTQRILSTRAIATSVHDGIVLGLLFANSLYQDMNAQLLLHLLLHLQ